jgi:protein tyrosine phosphatase (PTP) superfamily phosphohydrolase (DUF442 family)
MTIDRVPYRMTSRALRFSPLRVAFAAAVALAAALPARSAPPPLDGSSVERLALADPTIDPAVYRSSQPSEAEFRELVARYGIKTVIKLNPGTDKVPAGVRVAYHPIESHEDISDVALDRILDDLDKAERPVLIHCKAGRDRTGLVVGLWRLRHGVQAPRCYEDMCQMGYRPFYGLRTAWERATRQVPFAPPDEDAEVARSEGAPELATATAGTE